MHGSENKTGNKIFKQKKNSLVGLRNDSIVADILFLRI